jgi:hypothetical protein
MSHTGRVLDEGDSPGIIRIVTTGQIIITYRINEEMINELIFRIPEADEYHAAFTNKHLQFIEGDAVRINLKNPEKYRDQLYRIESESSDVFHKNKHWPHELQNLGEILSGDLKFKTRWKKHDTWPQDKNILYAQQLRYLPQRHVLRRLYAHLACIPTDDISAELAKIYAETVLPEDLFRPSLICIGDDFYPIHKVLLLSQENLDIHLSETNAKIVYYDPLDDIIGEENHAHHDEDDHAMDGENQCPVLVRPLGY